MLIPTPTDEDLMAEKLGIITLCKNCFKRIVEVESGQFRLSESSQLGLRKKVSILIWKHEESGKQGCYLRKTFGIDRIAVANPRKQK